MNGQEGPPMPRTLITHFRVHPGRECADYFTVRVYATQKHMETAYQVVRSAGEPEEDFDAVTVPWERLIIAADGTQTTHPEQGVILFYEESIAADTVSHEMTHAAISYLEETDGVDWSALKSDDAMEERLCYVQGWLTGEFWRKWQAYQRRRTRQA